MIASIRKALVPVVLTAVVLALEAIGVDIPAEADEQIAAGIVAAIFTYLVPNE